MNEKNAQHDKAVSRWQDFRLAALRALAGAMILAEYGTKALWRTTTWALAFAGLWMLQIPQLFGQIGEIAALILFIGGVVVITTRKNPRGGDRFTVPHLHDIDRRLEQDSNLPHRPLSESGDRLANPQKDVTRDLWDSARVRHRRMLSALRVPVPRAVLAAADPRALRVMALLLVLCGLTIAGPSWPARIQNGLFPFTIRAPVETGDDIMVWITPPKYTGATDIILSEKAAPPPDGPVAVPARSQIKIRVRGGFGAPVLDADGKIYTMEKLGPGSYGMVRAMPGGQSFTIRQGFFSRLHWIVAPVTDTPPTLTLRGKPEIGPRADVKIPITLHDDYGVQTLSLSVTLDPSITDPPLGADYTATQTIMSPAGQDFETMPSFDLAWHPWAGLPVVITLTAHDHIGQTAVSDPIRMTLPERKFRHPVARNLIDMRKRLAFTPVDSAVNVAYDIENIALNPGVYQGDLVIFTALRSAGFRLMRNRDSVPDIAAVVSLLWDLALRIEDGNISLTYRSLQGAQQALQNALNDPNTTDEELARLTDNLRQAMAEYLTEMAREMQKAMSGKDNLIPPEALAQMMDTRDMSAFLDQLLAQALSGDRKSAQDMLNELQSMMGSMDPSADMAIPKDMQQMMETIGDLQSVIEKQEELLRDTQDKARDTAPAETADMTGEKDRQAELSKDLADIMVRMSEAMGQIPKNMSDAAIAMRDAEYKLVENDAENAIPFQQDALDKLRQQQQKMAQQLQERMKQMIMLSFGGGSGKTDPLGRPIEDGSGKAWNKSKVEIPDEAERRRVYDILQELRKKSGELTRPEYELEYYRRLMRQF